MKSFVAAVETECHELATVWKDAANRLNMFNYNEAVEAQKYYLQRQAAMAVSGSDIVGFDQSVIVAEPELVNTPAAPFSAVDDSFVAYHRDGDRVYFTYMASPPTYCFV